MPTYEYQCEACGRKFDFFQSMNDPRLETCQFEDCDGKVKRLLGTGAGIIFKGSGFYETDYRSDSYKKGAESASKDGGGSTTKSDTGSTSGSSPAKESSKSSSDSSGSTKSASASSTTSSSGSSSTSSSSSSST